MTKHNLGEAARKLLVSLRDDGYSYRRQYAKTYQHDYLKQDDYTELGKIIMDEITSLPLATQEQILWLVVDYYGGFKE